jgi:hypothetical protein
VKVGPGLNRRSFLRGAAGAAIALPFLPDLTPRRVLAADPEPPVRLLTGFFGNGVMHEIFDRDDPLAADGGLAPLRPFLDKLAVLRGVDMNTRNGHPRGGGATFVGWSGREAQQEGPSIDIVARNALHPGGAPTPIRTLLVSSHFRRNHPYRMVHSWNEDGAPMGTPIERPTALFERLFGSVDVPGDDDDPAAARRLRYRRSVLDAVLADYRYTRSERAGLASDSRARIDDHLQRIRDIERRLFPEAGGDGDIPGGARCEAPARPADPEIPYGREADLAGVLVDHDAWAETQRLLAELVAMALRCDLTRFGNVTFQASGERVRFRGPYDYNGATISFDDDQAHHEHWHRRRFPECEWHTHWIMGRFATLLGELDDPAFPDENGNTVLENMVFLLGAELGDGSAHNTSNVFHAVSGGNGRIKTGGLVDVNASSVTVYNTILGALGVGRRMGDPDHDDPGGIDSLLLAGR